MFLLCYVLKRELNLVEPGRNCSQGKKQKENAIKRAFVYIFLAPTFRQPAPQGPALFKKRNFSFLKVNLVFKESMDKK